MLIALVDILFVGIILAAFLFGLKAGVAGIILIRPLTDRLFESASLEIAGHHVTYGIIVNIVVICATIFNISRIQRCTPAGLRSAWLPFLLVCAAAALYSPLQFDAARKALIYASYFSMFGLSFLVVKSERDVLFFLKLVILSSVLPVLYGLFETVSGIDRFNGSLSTFNANLFAGDRIQSTFNHPNIFAFYVLAVIGVILFLNATQHIRITGRLRLLLNLYLFPLLIVLIMTKTRSAWIGCLAMFFGYGLAFDRRVLALTLIGAPLAFAVPAINERIMNIMSDNQYIGGPAVLLNSYAWRRLLWESALPYIWRHPMFGYGLHSFTFYSAEFFYPAPGTYAHNDWLQVLFETGVVGLIAFLWIFWRCSIWLLYRWRSDAGGIAAAAALMVTYLICSFSDNLLEYLPYQWELWFAFGVICWHMERCRAHAASLGGHERLGRWSRFAEARRIPASGTAPRTAAGKLGRIGN